MKLIVISSSSAGNSYALDSGTEILLLEAGVKLSEVKRRIDFRLDDVVGCCISHIHGDHCKYATDYAKQGIACYGNQDIADKKKFPFGTYTVLGDSVTKNIGSFRVAPVPLCHDVPIYGYLVYHPQMGVLFFATDTYKIPEAMTGVDHFLIEANYSDEILKDNVWKGEVDKAQADRIMLSHMSLEYCIQYLRDSIDLNTKTITLCHLSERNSAFDLFRRKVAGAFGIPTYVAYNGFVVNLNKEEI